MTYTPPPRIIEGIPDLRPVRPKGTRKRWKDREGNIFEWDGLHGRLEKFDRLGRHLGEYDPNTGEQTKKSNPNYGVQP